MPTMNVNLSDDLARFVGKQTREGGYTNQSEVVREGLRLLRSQLAKRRALIRALEEGHADTLAGRVKPLTEGLLRKIATRGRRKAQVRVRGKA